MRKFIVSDLHGNGDIYDSIMSYLDNISLIDDVELYINGDLIDRGPDSFTMFEDVISRINGKGNVKINYLAGNHELMMYNALITREIYGCIFPWSLWYRNGGWTTYKEMEELDNISDKCLEYKDFLGKLRIYHKFEEKIQNNNILLVHAQPPKEIKDFCNMRIKNEGIDIESALWMREVDDFLEPNRIGKEGYLTIIGHTMAKGDLGFTYNKDQNYLNIDGGCGYYAVGYFEKDHVPLVEVRNNYLDITIFNHNNEIIDGYVFNGSIHKEDENILINKRKYIDHKYDNCKEEKQMIIKKLQHIN